MTRPAFPPRAGLGAVISQAAAGPLELFLVDGAQHIETYRVDKYVDAAVDKPTEFFAKHL